MSADALIIQILSGSRTRREIYGTGIMREESATAVQLGAFVARVPLHRITTGTHRVEKRRLRIASVLIPAGNLLLACRPAPACILSLEEWFQREVTLYQHLYGSSSVSRLSTGGISLPRLPGQPLARILAEAGRSWSEKLSALQCAVVSLGEFHVAGESGFPSSSSAWLPTSHGDATVANVLVCLPSLTSRWIDFDTAHRLSVPPLMAKVDDLRALLTSACSAAGAHQSSQLLDTICSTYPDCRIVDNLRQSLGQRRFRYDLLHHAQAACRDVKTIKN